jgi:hypothetical protein
MFATVLSFLICYIFKDTWQVPDTNQTKKCLVAQQAQVLPNILIQLI